MFLLVFSVYIKYKRLINYLIVEIKGLKPLNLNIIIKESKTTLSSY